MEEGEVAISGAGVGNAELCLCISNLMILTCKHGLPERKSLNQNVMDDLGQR
jgi:hypothetical protein